MLDIFWLILIILIHFNWLIYDHKMLCNNIMRDKTNLLLIIDWMDHVADLPLILISVKQWLLVTATAACINVNLNPVSVIVYRYKPEIRSCRPLMYSCHLTSVWMATICWIYQWNLVSGKNYSCFRCITRKPELHWKYTAIIQIDKVIEVT